MSAQEKQKAVKKQAFQAEVSKLLDIVANSLYSQRDVFLRELISNASDACDKLRHLSITQKDLIEAGHEFSIAVDIRENDNQLIIRDNGIGMDDKDLADHLGTIAKSGTAHFVDAMDKNNAHADTGLIGQFGVGFYAAFMVADEVKVISRKAGTDQSYEWVSDGATGYEITPVDTAITGTEIILTLKENAKEFLDFDRVMQVVQHYSDHINFPIHVTCGEKNETANVGTALWARNKNELSEENYHDFYKHLGAGFDIPQHYVHWTAEGVIEYTGLLYIPSMRPMDLFDPHQKHGVKLYVKRIFITDNCDGLIPIWLRFLRGVIDSKDLPLNISREMLQKDARGNPILQKIRAGVIKKILGEIETLKKDDSQFPTFWKNFGPVLKEGLYEVGDHRDRILKLAVFDSNTQDDKIHLDDYIGRMGEKQDYIYYMTGKDAASMKASPQMEVFNAKGIEVILMSDTIDEFWVPVLGQYGGKEFRSITKDTIDLSSFDDKKSDGDEAQNDENDDDMAPLLERMKGVLKNHVKDVRTTNRLTQSPVCLVADKGDADLNLEKIMKGRQGFENLSLRILEINPDHPLIQKMARDIGAEENKRFIDDAAWLLLDQARIIEGDAPLDVSRFARLMNDLMVR